MSRHDLAVPSEMATPAKKPRDPRIDAFRGLALLMIYINHSPSNPYEYLTSRNWGFSDAAEGFFIMSGVAAGMAYSGRFLPQNLAKTGLWHAIAPMWKRSWTLYLTHLLLAFWAIAIFAAGARFLGLDELLTKINLKQVFNNTEAALIGIPILTHQFGYMNILPVYSVLLFVGPVAILTGLRHPWLLWTASVALWFAAGLWRLNFPNYPNPGGWFFNPLSWQFLFITGLLTGTALKRGDRFIPKSPWLLGAALGWLALVLAWRYVPGLGPFLNQKMALMGKLGAPFHLVSHDKTFLALPRLMHALALAYVLSYFGWITRACGSRALAFTRLLGRQGLLVYASGTVLALTNHVIMTGWDATWLKWTLIPIGFGILVVIAWLADLQKTLRPA